MREITFIRMNYRLFSWPFSTSFFSFVIVSQLMSSMWVKAQDRMNELDLKLIEDLFQIEEKVNATGLCL